MRSISISIDEGIFDNSEAIFEEMGLDMQTAIKMFLKKVIKERRMPFELSASQPLPAGQPISALSTSNANSFNVEDRDAMENRVVTRSMSKITDEMRIAVWNEFKRRYLSGDKNIQDAAWLVNKQTGMNRGSAFIYFTMLNNFVDGVYNTRNMKYEDLEFFVYKIKTELPENVLKSAIVSLKASIPYWDEKIPGSFAAKVSRLVERFKDF